MTWSPRRSFQIYGGRQSSHPFLVQFRLDAYWLQSTHEVLLRLIAMELR